MAFTPESVNALKRICLSAIGLAPEKFTGLLLIDNKGFSDQATGCASFDRLLSGAPSGGDGMNGKRESVPLKLSLVGRYSSHTPNDVTRVERLIPEEEGVLVRESPKLQGGDLGEDEARGGQREGDKSKESHLEVFQGLYLPQLQDSSQGRQSLVTKNDREEDIKPIPVTIKLDRGKKLLVEMTVMPLEPSDEDSKEMGSEIIEIELV